MRAALQQNPGLAVIGEARNRAEAAAEAARTRPDVVLFDADLPSEDLADSCALIGERSSSTKVLVLAGEESLATIIEALEGGASGYLTKESPAKDLIEATEPVSRGETWIPSHLLGALVARLFRPWREEGEALERMPHLTPRERQVLALLANGEDNRTIDRRMAISPETARTHTQNILRKLEVHTRLEAAMFVRQNVPRTRPPCGEGVACPI